MITWLTHWKALRNAYDHGHIECVKVIIQNLVQKEYQYQKSNVVHKIIPQDISAANVFSDIIVASRVGNCEAVKHLLNDSRVDPSAQDNRGKNLNDMM